MYPVDGTWMHVAATFDGTTLRMYINGILESSVAATGQTIAANALPLMIGGQDGTAPGRYFLGWMDEARVYNRALSATEIMHLAGVTPTYALIVNKTGTGSGTVTNAPAGIDCGGTCSYSFNETTLVTLTAVPNPGSTFTGWSGAYTGAGACAVTMDGNKTVTATFAQLPGSFNKSGPANGLNGYGGSSLTLSWGASSGVASYEYCLDTTNNGTCDGSWVDNGMSTSKVVSGLVRGQQYYWQVRAVNVDGSTYANGGSWWSFATLAGSFSKVSPAKGATGQSLSPTLSWGASSGATSYEYCLDTTNNGTCDGSWVNTGTSRTVTLSGLLPNTPYYWQVRSFFAGSYYYGDSGTCWSFTTVP
jgi:hypothetical protein